MTDEKKQKTRAAWEDLSFNTSAVSPTCCSLSLPLSRSHSSVRGLRRSTATLQRTVPELVAYCHRRSTPGTESSQKAKRFSSLHRYQRVECANGGEPCQGRGHGSWVMGHVVGHLHCGSCTLHTSYFRPFRAGSSCEIYTHRMSSSRDIILHLRVHQIGAVFFLFGGHTIRQRMRCDAMPNVVATTRLSKFGGAKTACTEGLRPVVTPCRENIC